MQQERAKIICARCGSSEKPMAGSLCVDCFAETTRLYSLPELEVKKCPTCGKLRLGGKWVNEAGLSNWVKGRIKPGYTLKSAAVSVKPAFKGVVANLSLVFDVRGMKVAREDAVPIKIELDQCIECSRIASGYHEAIIQLRGSHEKIEAKANKMISMIERTSFISGVKHKKEGVDLEVGSKQAAQNAISELGFPLSATYKLITRRNGKNVYRTSYCVRL